MIDGSLSIQVSARYVLDDVERAREELERRNTIGNPIIDCAPLQKGFAVVGREHFDMEKEASLPWKPGG
jgi:hypothetical protein